MDKVWLLVVGVVAIFSALEPTRLATCCNAYPWHPWNVWFYFLIFELHGLMLLLFVILCPSVFQLPWCNVLDKMSLVQIFGILLLRV